LIEEVGPGSQNLFSVFFSMHFALADTRGGFGSVAEVWQVFASQFAQVIGVAGNHDNVRQVSRGHGALLDGNWVTMGALCVGGTGLIMGHSSKPGRRADADQLDRIEAVAEARPDILILHEGPPGGAGQPGQTLIEENLFLLDPFPCVTGEPMDAVIIETEALRMPESNRALLADRLLESLTQVSVAQREEWINESAERYEAYQQGKLQAVDGPGSIAVLREMFAK
jgi:hypothetical protein